LLVIPAKALLVIPAKAFPLVIPAKAGLSTAKLVIQFDLAS
jgi:hypothetical protein